MSYMQCCCRVKLPQPQEAALRSRSSSQQQSCSRQQRGAACDAAPASSRRSHKKQPPQSLLDNAEHALRCNVLHALRVLCVLRLVVAVAVTITYDPQVAAVAELRQHLVGGPPEEQQQQQQQ